MTYNLGAPSRGARFSMSDMSFCPASAGAEKFHIIAFCVSNQGLNKPGAMTCKTLIPSSILMCRLEEAVALNDSAAVFFNREVCEKEIALSAIHLQPMFTRNP